MNDIKKLREMTGAGLADCKKALAESDDMDGAVAYLRKKGQAVAAKRSDREAAEGCVLVKAENGFAAIIALKCETDFVANNADFVALTQSILDAAVAAKCKTLDEVKALPMGEGTVADAVTARSGITGEKMELDGYCTIEGENIATYNHMNRNGLCTMLNLSKKVEDETVGKNIAMQIASASPVAIDETGVPQSVKDNEFAVAIEKSKAEQVQKAVEAAIKKAGFNPAHFDSEDHMESNQAKGWQGKGNHCNRFRREGCKPEPRHDREHRKGSCEQVPQRELPDESGVHLGQEPYRCLLSSEHRQGADSHRLQALHSPRRIRRQSLLQQTKKRGHANGVSPIYL